MAVRKLAADKLRGAWEDVRAEMLYNYHTYYEIREILTVDASNANLDDNDDDDDDYSTSTPFNIKRKQKVED